MTELHYPQKKEVSIVYVAGYGRSGSTLLDILLSNAPGVCGLGELSNFYELCGNPETEQKLSDGFWGGVKKEVSACVQGNEHYKEIFCNANAIQRETERFVGGWRYFFPLGNSAIGKYKVIMDCLLRAVANASKPNCILVDSSKTAWLTSWRPYYLNKIGYRVKIIHLVRDGRGVINSFLRGDDNKIEQGLEDVSYRFPVIRSIAGWIFANISAYINCKLLPRGNSFLLKYDDLVNNTEQVLENLGEFLEVDFSRVKFKLSESEGLQNKNVSFSGNRMRNCSILTINTELAKPLDLKKLHLCCYWAVAGWMHYLIFCRSQNDG